MHKAITVQDAQISGRNKFARIALAVAFAVMCVPLASMLSVATATDKAHATTYTGQWRPGAITNGNPDNINITPAIDVKIDYVPGDSTMEVSFRKASLNIIGSGTSPYAWFWDGFVLVRPPEPDVVYKGCFTQGVGTDTKSKAQQDFQNYAKSGGGAVWWVTQLNCGSSQWDNGGDLADGAWHTYTYDISSYSVGESPVLLYYGNRSYQGDTYGSSVVGTINTLTAASLGMNIKMAPKVTSSSGSGGTVSPAGTKYYEYGSNVSYSVKPNTGYAIKDVIIDNVSRGAITSFTFQNVTDNHTIAATFDPNPYKIVFNANGGENTMANQTMVYDKAANLNELAFKKTGYTFTGWNTKADGTGTTYANKASVKNLTTTRNGTVNLYAQWRANTYSIAFAGNGGTGSMTEQPMIYDEPADLPANKFSRDGYTWLRWSTTPTGQGDAYQDKAKVINLTSKDASTVTLYAQWAKKPHVVYEDGFGTVIDEQTIDAGSNAKEPEPPHRPGHKFKAWSKPPTNIVKDTTIYAIWEPCVYEIAFDPNSGTGDMDNMRIPYGKEAKLAKNSYSHTGYTWTGWNSEPDGSGTSYADEQKVQDLTDTDETVTMYAQWEPNHYTVRFHPNEAAGEMEDMDMVFGEPKQITKCAYTRPGYTFGGWSLELRGPVAYEDEAMTRNRAHESGAVVYLYAVWREDPEVLIQYAPLDPDTADVTRQSDVVMPKTGDAQGSRALPRPGYKFISWIDPAGNTAYTTQEIRPERDKDGIYKPASYFAVTEPISYTLSYDGNGGKGSIPSVTLAYGKATDAADNTFTRSGFTFIGRNTERDGSGLSYMPNDRLVNLTTDDGSKVVLYAQWVADVYEIAYVANEGTGSMDNTHMLYGKEANLTPCAFERTGYAFANWNTKADGTGTSYADAQAVRDLTTDGSTVSLYAQWQPCPYTVIYDSNGGAGSMPDQSMRYGKAYELDPNKYHRSGYVFAGWNTKADGTGTDYSDMEQVSNLTSEHDGKVTLYAKWVLKVYTVTFEDGYGSTLGTTKVEHGHGVDAPDPGLREGFEFTGWDKDLTCITEDTVATASWRDVRVHKGWDGTPANPTSPQDGNTQLSATGAHASSWDKTADATDPLLWMLGLFCTLSAAAMAIGLGRRHHVR